MVKGVVDSVENKVEEKKLDVKEIVDTIHHKLENNNSVRKLKEPNSD